MSRLYIGIDNGTTGTMGVIYDGTAFDFIEIPAIKQQDYTKAKKNITRIDCRALGKRLLQWKSWTDDKLAIVCGSNMTDCEYITPLVILERPMIDPKRFAASISAARALESVLTVLEVIDLPYMFVDSRWWQKELLPKGTQGVELKKASADVGCRLFPDCKEEILQHKDADGLLIAYKAYMDKL